MKNMTIENIVKACGGVYKGDESLLSREITGVEIDSRKIEAGNLFIATKGERVDGHSFINQVLEKGALCVVCEDETKAKEPYILVGDSFKALKDIAAFYRSQLSIPIVGITGSVGKTSTKEAIASVLSAKYNVLKTAGNFNNEVGMPLTLLRIREEHEAAVIEMGISDFGEMERLSSIARPDVCVITNIGLCHLENLGTQQGILKAKTEMFEHRNPEGAVILNGDDPLLSGIKDVDGTKPLFFGRAAASDMRIEAETLKGLLGSEFILKSNGETLCCKASMPGGHVVTNSACAALVGKVLGLSNAEIEKGISEQKSVGGRSNLIQTERYLLIDDCYNANPVSMKEAIDLLNLSNSRKVAILGDMFELGENERELHRSVGEYINEKPVDVLLCAGDMSREIYEGAVNVKIKQHFETRDELIKSLSDILKDGDSVLIKASHGMHFEEIVSKLNS